MMYKKNLLAFAAVALSFAACSEIDEAPPVVTNVQPETQQEFPIVFGTQSKGTTRADFTGADAATLLNNKFVVSGYKGPKTEWSDGSSIVFDNYLVEFSPNSAHSTESNTSNWEYVGKGLIKYASDHGITRQSTKYWDYTKPQYDFIAWSTGGKTAIFEGDPADGKVLVSAITPSTAFGTDGMAYTMKGASADLTNCYVADLVTVKKAQYGDNPVTIRFRSLGAKVRIGLYETVPGYSVRDVKFYSAAAVALANETTGSDEEKAEAIKTNATPRLFTTTENMVYTQGTYTIFYPTVDDTENADNNQAHIRFAGTGDQSTVVNFGALNYTSAEDGEKIGTKFLGRTSNTASMAGEAEGNYYTQYLPNESGTNLNLRVNYTLESIDGSGEVIEVKGATAQVPSIYTQWKAGFAYTYLFKISDKTNGHTGVYDPTKPDDTTVNSDPAGLYPITFDAVVVNAEDNDQTQETITLVSTPSITTYQQGSNVVNNNEYTNVGPIFVTVSEGNADTPDLANGKLQKLNDKAALYTIPDGKTEAEVIDALQMRDDDAADGTIKGRNGLVLTDVSSSMELTANIRYGVDGNMIVVGSREAARFTPTENTTYAFVYTKTAPTDANDDVKYQALNWSSFESGQTKYRYDYKATVKTHTVVDDKGTSETTDDISTDYFDAQNGVKYFSKTGGIYKMETPFIGQGVGNLYLDAAGNTRASGYAVSGTTYYYTKGMSYVAAHNVKYEDFAAATDLYTFDGTTYTAKSSEVTTPANNTAYYYKDGDNYIYCVILPQQTNTWFELDTTKYVVANEAAAVDGMTYFDKYTKNDGVYYAKVIKVQ
jgi:hypothetical protein